MAGRIGLAALGLALLAAAAPAGADEVAGVARVIDGDTLAIGATRIRLFGIDAPETHQRCGGAEAEWDCGRAAAARLEALAAGGVHCTGDDHDRYGRLLAVCDVAGLDLGAELVAEGLAWAYVRYSELYVPVEAEARGRQVGLWQGAAEAPWQFRANGGFVAAAGTAAAAGDALASEAPPDGCAIKGNISGSGERIYHLPGQESYARTRIDPRKGEAWFCDEATAQAAGFRPRRK